jgi:hypothetical protein
MRDYCNHDHDTEVGHAYLNIGQRVQSKNVRLLKNDPEYERINGLRQAREHRYLAKIYLIVGLVTLPLLGAGIPFLIISFTHSFNASRLESKYRE